MKCPKCKVSLEIHLKGIHDYECPNEEPPCPQCKGKDERTVELKAELESETNWANEYQQESVEKGNRIAFLEAEIQKLQGALRESVRLQAHYAGLINKYDGGERHIFKDANEWINRLQAPSEGKEAE